VIDGRTLGHALVTCVAERTPGERRAALGPIPRDDLVRLAFHALHHRVVPFLYLALLEAGIGVDDDALASLRRTYGVRAGEHLRSLADLDTARGILDKAGVPFLLVKGPAIAERLYPSPDLRVYDDLDIVVAPADFSRAIDAFEASGLELLDRNWDLIRREGRGQLHLRLPLGTLADVHWHLLNREVVRNAFDVRVEALFERARRIDLLGTPTRTLDPVDTLLHLGIHAALSGADRLLWLKDLERAVVVDAPPWDELIARARVWRAGPALAVTLARSRRALGTPVPDEVLKSLFGGSARASVSSWVDRGWPVESATGRVTASVLWAQVIRDAWPSTFTTLVGRAGRRSRSLMREGDRPGADAPILRPTGRDEDERDYLRAVSEGSEEPPR
jgi:hypothetical protein